MRIAQRSVKKRFKRALSKGQLQADIEKSTFSRHMWANAMHMKYGPQPQSEYPLPPYPCLEDVVSERIEHHFSDNEWSCPAEGYTTALGKFKRFVNRRLDSK